jgi:hypothetical protein
LKKRKENDTRTIREVSSFRGTWQGIVAIARPSVHPSVSLLRCSSSDFKANKTLANETATRRENGHFDIVCQKIIFIRRMKEKKPTKNK